MAFSKRDYLAVSKAFKEALAQWGGDPDNNAAVTDTVWRVARAIESENLNFNMSRFLVDVFGPKTSREDQDHGSTQEKGGPSADPQDGSEEALPEDSYRPA